MLIKERKEKLCLSCGKVHEVPVVIVEEENVFKGTKVRFNALYEYCDLYDEYNETEELMDLNDISFKDAYRKEAGLLTGKEIKKIREKYQISQKDLSILLGWGAKTITRYEGHQVQDAAHDSILRRIDTDPEWYVELLKKASDLFSKETYQKYYEAALNWFMDSKDIYLKKAICSEYANYENEILLHGNTELNFDKVVDVISYFANHKKVSELYKTKLMKLLWYTDALSFKRYSHAITGLVYRAYPMGALPVGHDSIIDLKGVNCEEKDFDDYTVITFQPTDNHKYASLSEEDKDVLETVIMKLGSCTRKQIILKMHEEEAYQKTQEFQPISFVYAKDLSIQ